MRQVPRWRDEDVVGEDLRLLRVEVRRPRVAIIVAAAVASASLVAVRHRSLVEGEVEEGEGRGDEEGECKERIGQRLSRVFADLRRHAWRIEVAARIAWLHRMFPHVAIKLTVASGTSALFMASTYLPVVVIN
jgi:hypothetical protein